MKHNFSRIISSRSNGSPSSSGASIKIGTKIFALVGFCLTLLAIVASTSIFQMEKIGIEIVSIAERDMPLANSLTELTIRQLEQAVNLERAIRTGEYMKKVATRQDFKKSVSAFEELTIEIEKDLEKSLSIARAAENSAVTKEGRQEFGKISGTLEKLAIERKGYSELSEQVVKLIEAGNVERALTLMPKLKAGQEDLNKKVKEMLVEVETFTARATMNAEEHEKFALNLLMGISGLAVLLGLSFSIFLVKRSITRPLGEIVTGLEALNSDDFSVDVKIYNNDEIGAIAKAYALFKDTMIKAKDQEADQEKQKQIAEEEKRKSMLQLADDFESSVGSIVEYVASASTELNTTAQSMASVSEETNSQATSVAAASEEASMNVQTVASAAEEMTASITEINTQVFKAADVSKQAVENVEKTVKQMDQLTHTADKIGEVVSMISDIAEQTNLLALNATIESARAGEAGKGFAVVAGEVKALASETAKATDEIASHINQIQSATKGAVASIADIGTVVKQLKESSTAIAAAMEEQGATTQEISRNVQEAATGTSEVSSSIAGVTQASQEAGAASEQVMSSAGELSQQAETLKTVVAQFLANMRDDSGNRPSEDNPDYKGVEMHKNSGKVEDQVA